MAKIPEKHIIHPDYADYFKQQWQRIMPEVGIYLLPFSEEERNKVIITHFWSQLAQEILKKAAEKHPLVKAFNRSIQSKPDVLLTISKENIYWDKLPPRTEKKLLTLHQQICG